jgi:integrase
VRGGWLRTALGECAGLAWEWMDLDAAELHVRQVAVEVGGRLQLRPYPKSRVGLRTVPVPAFVVDALRLRRPEPSVGLVFGTRSGNPIRRPNFRRVWVAAVVRSGLLPALRFHDLRHSFAPWLVSDGVPINVVSRLMGHEQISTTLDRYTHDARDYADVRVRQVFTGLSADDLLTSGRE